MSFMHMITTHNVAWWDRIIRALPALATFHFWWDNQLTGLWLIAAIVVSAGFLMTSLMGSCSIYYSLGWSTVRRRVHPRRRGEG